MAEKYLCEALDAAAAAGCLKKGIPNCIGDNLNPGFELRPYQEQAFYRFFHCLDNGFPGKAQPLHFLFNMATGSGKTLIMAGMILYLYQRGYRNFLFFVHSTSIIEKTKDNFLNPLSSKFLFRDHLRFGARSVSVTPVANFEGVNPNDINICFTTIQKLHRDLTHEKENQLTCEDFSDDKIVLLADEAHHMNTRTRAQREMFESWENTVERIFHRNPDNLLLEFTATMDYDNGDIAGKYGNKVLFRYDLRQFHNDGYAKDVSIVQADFEESDRMIQALILSQYKQEVAAVHRIDLKPVILFKAQRTIAQSLKNKARFHRLMDRLSAADIERVRRRSDIPLVARAFRFFTKHGITDGQLAERLHAGFQERHCISVNEEQEKAQLQLLLNSLEDRDNRIRAVFAVQKLNEGWDVLNLFDIVRCYSSRDSTSGRPGKTTLAEAQLIGRGARYFPFVTSECHDRFKRKYDKDPDNEMRVLEELHYHSINDSGYIAQLRTALLEEGVMDDRAVAKSLKLKPAAEKAELYKDGPIFPDGRIGSHAAQARSFSDLGVPGKNHTYKIAGGRGGADALLSGSRMVEGRAASGKKDVKVSDLPRHIVRNALARRSFFTFRKVKNFFPCISSMSEFMESEDYLGGMQITFQGDLADLKNLSNSVQMGAIHDLLERLASELSKSTSNTQTDGMIP
jgi:type III restriction enzyme